MYIVLSVLLVAVLIVALIYNRKDYISPSVLFAAGFAVCAIWGAAYPGFWGLSLHAETFLVVLFGVICFVAVATSINRVLLDRRKDKASAPHYEAFPELRVRLGVLACFVVFQIVVLVWSAVVIMQKFPADGIMASISAYDQAVKFTDATSNLGFPLSAFRNICRFGLFVILLMQAQEIVAKRWRNVVLLAFSVAVGVLIELTSGGRMGVVRYAFMLVVFIYALSRMRKKTNARINRSIFGVAIILILSFVVVFPATQGLVGRALSGDPVQYAAVYFGSQIPNLDYFILNVGQQDTGVWGSMTFINLINYFGDKLHISSWVYAFDQPMLTLNGIWTGNVYTTFYSFIYDFGYIGVFVLTAIMAAISQLMHELVRRGGRTQLSYLALVVYAYIAYALIMSFYCDRFYEDLFSIDFIRNFIYAALLKWVLCDCMDRSGKQRMAVVPVMAASNRAGTYESERVGKLEDAPKGLWYRLRMEGIQEMLQGNKRIKKMLLTGCIAAVACAAIFGVAGYLNAVNVKESYVAIETFNISAQSGANDSQATKTSLGGTTANDMTEYLKSAELREKAFESAGISKSEEKNYVITISHTASTRVISVEVTGTDKQRVENLFNSAISLAESAGTQSFNLASMEKVSSDSQAVTAKLKNGGESSNPLRAALLFALAGFVVGILLTIAWRALDPRVNSENDAELASGYMIAGRVNLHSV